MRNYGNCIETDSKTLPGIPGRVLLKKKDREDGEEKQEKNNIPVL
jgi:hypothetical protein